VKKTLLRESRWARHYKTGEKKLMSESKFLTGEVSITCEELKNIWDTLDEREICDFTLGFMPKEMAPQEYDKIVEFVFPKLSPPFISNFSDKVSQLSDKRRAMDLLVNGAAQSPLEERANFYQAMGLLGLPEVLPWLESELRELLVHPLLWELQELMNDVAGSCVVCLREILTLRFDNQRYEQLLKFKDHPNNIVRTWVEMAVKGVDASRAGT
jgi:hypothetical protein